MSPLSLRRYRAERLLRDEFDALRERVIAVVRGRLVAVGAPLDRGDLEGCYAQAWHGLYVATIDGREIENPAGWLVVVTLRRAIEEGRARRCSPTAEGETTARAGEEDLAAQLDDRLRLRQLMEGLRGRLSGREREAAALCYLQGLSRAEAAARMGISEGRMRKLMEGRAPGRPGVAAKVGALVETIQAGAWCEQQGSLMRALAFGILDPEGERYALAVMHRGECPACRAYVRSLRGLAAALPAPLWHAGLGGALLSAVAGGGGSAVAGKGVLAGARTWPLAGAGGASGASAGTTALSGAGGVAGGGLLGLPLAGKLVLGCLLALGIGAGCIAIGARGHPRGEPARAGFAVGASSRPYSRALLARAGPIVPSATIRTPRARPVSDASTYEFSPEQAPPRLTARSAVTGAAPVDASASPSAAEREFAP